MSSKRFNPASQRFFDPMAGRASYCANGSCTEGMNGTRKNLGQVKGRYQYCEPCWIRVGKPLQKILRNKNKIRKQKLNLALNT